MAEEEADGEEQTITMILHHLTTTVDHPRINADMAEQINNSGDRVSGLVLLEVPRLDGLQDEWAIMETARILVAVGAIVGEAIGTMVKEVLGHLLVPASPTQGTRVLVLDRLRAGRSVDEFFLG